MKKLVSLIKACMTEDMNLFRVRGKNVSAKSKKILPVFLAFMLFFSIWSYANMIMEVLIPIKQEHVLLTIFAVLTTVMTVFEGTYKSSNLLFNCKDDNMLLSLPIKKSTVLFIRVFKFYVFEVLYNALFFLPAMIVYPRYVPVGPTYFLVSVMALLLLPVVPIVISCIIGAITSATSSKFKFRNIAQIIITMLFVLAVMFASFNLQALLGSIANNASNINSTVSQVYYPISAYQNLVTNFNVGNLLIFIAIHIGIMALAIALLSTVYFKINSSVKAIKKSVSKSEYKIKTRKVTASLINKELKKFINTPVFVTNAAFGLVLFLVACIGICVKFDDVVQMVASKDATITVEQIKSYIPIILFCLICFASLMSSITSSMISLEGKSFAIIKSLPVKPSTVILSKVYAAVSIIIPMILLGNLIVFCRFSLSIIDILVILATSIVLPLVSQVIGILVNLKYPKMNAENDTEVIKQSTSSTVAVFMGMALTGASIFALYKCIAIGINITITLAGGLAVYAIVLFGLLIYMKKQSTKMFKNINV